MLDRMRDSRGTPAGWVEGKAWLVNRFVVEAELAGASTDEIAALLASLGESLWEALSYLDGEFGVWLYEFGKPLRLKRSGREVWGANYLPLSHLVVATRCALARIEDRHERETWFSRLGDEGKHRAFLAEMMPMARCAARDATYEVAGFGAGKRTVDWMIGEPGGGKVLVEVKQRVGDLVEAMDHPDVTRTGPVPRHDHDLLFKDVQDKLIAADPDVVLQGAWIATDIKQERSELAAAFAKLDGDKVHFAVFGDFEPGVHILVRRERDRDRLVRLLGVAEDSERFVFDRDGGVH